MAVTVRGLNSPKDGQIAESSQRAKKTLKERKDNQLAEKTVKQPKDSQISEKTVK